MAPDDPVFVVITGLADEANPIFILRRQLGSNLRSAGNDMRKAYTTWEFQGMESGKSAPPCSAAG